MKTTNPYMQLTAICILIALVSGCKKNKSIDDTEEPDNLGPRITMTTTLAAGEKMYLYLDAALADQADVWIDLNNNQQRDEGESITKFEIDDPSGEIELTISAKTVTLYGKVTRLVCSSNQLTSLDLAMNRELTHVYCNINKLTLLDLTKNTKLIQLSCYQNRITSLDLTQSTALTHIYASDNQLSSLDLTQNTKLTLLEFSSNQLSTIDLTHNTKLKVLYCRMNQLTSLGLNQNTELTHLFCHNNQLTTLDLAQNTKLVQVSCYYNKINQTAMNSLLFSLIDRRTTTQGDAFVYRPNTTIGTAGNWEPTAQLINTVRLQKNWIVKVI